MAVLLVLALNLGCVPSVGSASTQVLDDLGLSGEHRIGGFDILAEPSGVVHLAWTAVSSSSVPVPEGLWYRRREPGAGWSRPALLASGPALQATWGPPPRFATEPGSIHLFAGHHLLHFASPDGGTTWTQMPLILRKDELARSFDVAGGDSGIVVSYLSNEPTDFGSLAVDSLNCWVRSLHGMDYTPPVRVAEVPGAEGDQPPMRLLASPDGLELVYGVNGIWREKGAFQGREVEKFGGQAHLYYSISRDRGTSWSTPEFIAGPRSRGEAPTGFATDIAAVRCGGTLHVLYGASVLYGVDLGQDGRWTSLRRIAPHESFWAGASQVRSVTAVGWGPDGRIAWTDTRHRPVNPLQFVGGPETMTNDVLSLPLSKLLGEGADPERWTGPGAYTDCVRSTAIGDSVYVLWSSRGMDHPDRDKRAAPSLTLRILAAH